MPGRYFQRDFRPNTYHHIFNRGCFKQKIFRKKKDYEVFIDILKYYLRHPALCPLSKLSQPRLKKCKKTSIPYQLLAYCLMPNHFHLLLHQKEVGPTLTSFMRKISITYAMYFQNKYHHSGALFQGKFKCNRVTPSDGLLYISKYIHLNPSGLEGSEPSNYPWSSMKSYLSETKTDWLHPEIIFEIFFAKSQDCRAEYKKYCLGPVELEKELFLSKMEGSEPSI